MLQHVATFGRRTSNRFPGWPLDPALGGSCAKRFSASPQSCFDPRTKAAHVDGMTFEEIIWYKFNTNSYNNYCRYATLPVLGQFPRAGSCAGLFPLAEMVIHILAMLLWYVDEKSNRKAQEMLDLETKRHGFRMIQVCILDSILKISDAWMVLNHHILSWHSTTFSWELLFQVWVYNYCP